MACGAKLRADEPGAPRNHVKLVTPEHPPPQPVGRYSHALPLPQDLEISSRRLGTTPSHAFSLKHYMPPTPPKPQPPPTKTQSLDKPEHTTLMRLNCYPGFSAEGQALALNEHTGGWVDGCWWMDGGWRVLVVLMDNLVHGWVAESRRWP